MNRTVNIIGGGTVNYVRSHLAISAPAYGGTARMLHSLCRGHDQTMDVNLYLTRMADPSRPFAAETSDDLLKVAQSLAADPLTKIVFFNAAVADFVGQIDEVNSGKLSPRLKTKEGQVNMVLTPAEKIVKVFRKERKDIFLVAFKATCDATPQEQYSQGLDMLKACSANLVFANDVATGHCMIISPEEAVHYEGKDRAAMLLCLVHMAYQRSHLTFTRSTVVAGEPVPWDSPDVPQSLRTVVDHCIKASAYRKVRGVTAGHFAVKLSSTEFLTSRRKTDFNKLSEVGLVRVTTDGPDSVVAYGSKPSVGGQSQRIVFNDHPDEDCVVHFHCPKFKDSPVPTVSQAEFECGSHECGRNTSNGLQQFGQLKAVYLDKHGPNIVFNRNVDPQVVIDFIEANFDLSQKSGGYQLEG